jgi:hypothetical protein
VVSVEKMQIRGSAMLSDRNLLFSILALQMDFISGDSRRNSISGDHVEHE